MTIAPHPRHAVRVSQKPGEPRRRIARFVLLAGGLKAAPIVDETGLSSLDLPVSCSETLLDAWLRQIRLAAMSQCDDHSNGSSAAESIGDERGAVASEFAWADVALAESHSMPRSRRAQELEAIGSPVSLHRMTDSGLRGPAGAVRDVCDDLDDSDSVVIIEAGRYLDGDMGALIARHFATGADVTATRNASGAPAGVYISTGASLRLIAREGFIDIKEQWLCQVAARGGRIMVATIVDGASRSVRTRQDLLALMYARRGASGGRSQMRRFQSRVADGSELSLIMAGARVNEAAAIVESIVMSGASVEADAVVVRSIICPGAIVRRREVIVDSVVNSATHNRGRTGGERRMSG